MTRYDVTKLVEIISLNYKDFIKQGEMKSFVDLWENALKDYNYRDVKNQLEKLMAMSQFQYQPPTLPYLVKDVPTAKDVLRLTKYYYCCNICHEKFRTEGEYEKHFSRCSSVRYVMRQHQKYFGDNLNREKLMKMSDYDFNTRYNYMLAYIHEHTENTAEKKSIEHIWSPPNEKEAKEFLESVSTLW